MEAMAMSEIIVITVFFRLTTVRASTTMSRRSDSPWMSPPIVAPRKSISPAFDIHPNLNVVPMTGRGTCETR